MVLRLRDETKKTAHTNKKCGQKLKQTKDMSYKWKPSASQRRAFAERMKDPAEQAAYEARKIEKAKKRRAGSQFDYETAGGRYVPTKEQHDFCFNNIHMFVTSEEVDAANMVMSGFACNEKVHHDYIHIVNEIMRSKI